MRCATCSIRGCAVPAAASVPDYSASYHYHTTLDQPEDGSDVEDVGSDHVADQPRLPSMAA